MIRAIQFQNKRVGSTFLQQAIDSHPNIAGIDEVFVNVARRSNIRKSGFVPFVNSDVQYAGKYIEEVIWKTHPNTNLIFKIMYNQIIHHQGLRGYIKNNNIPIIHLMRKNLLWQVISFAKMGEYNHNPIHIDPKKLYNSVEIVDNLNKVYAQNLKNNIKLTLYYEDIIGDTKDGYTYVTETAMRSICEFFEVNYFPLCAATKKKLKNDMSVYLPNIEEVRKYFKGRKYEWMIT